jgi:hypothetical protein
MKITGLEENKLVSWSYLGEADDWTDTKIDFKLDRNDGKTRVRFEHSGYKESGDFYANCNFSWGRYLESLRQLCQTGKGEAFGSPGYRT